MAPAEPQLTGRAPRSALVAVAAALLSACGNADRHPSAPSPRTRIAAPVEHELHATLHALPRVCSRRDSDPAALGRVTGRFIDWYRRYPYDRYEIKIDDESGTMLSAILVLRYELASCSPIHAAKIDAVLPAKIRNGLKPLPPRAPRAG